MTIEQQYSRLILRVVDRLRQDMGILASFRADHPGLNDETVCMIALRNSLKEIAEEAEANVRIALELKSLLGNNDDEVAA